MRYVIISYKFFNILYQIYFRYTKHMLFTSCNKHIPYIYYIYFGYTKHMLYILLAYTAVYISAYAWHMHRQP